MRNLKRALSLALALVMVLSMMVVGAGAVSVDDFSDASEIVNKEAVSVLATLNVINGKDDGSYDPTGIVTRAEMAKMICVVLNGGRDPQLGAVVTDSHMCTSVPGVFAAGDVRTKALRQVITAAADGANAAHWAEDYLLKRV